MEKRKLLAKKQKELLEINKKINDGLNPSFIKTFLRPLIIGILGLILGQILSFSDTQKIGMVLIFYFLSLFFFTIRDKKIIEKEKEKLIEKRLEMQKEIVKLMREIKNESN